MDSLVSEATGWRSGMGFRCCWPWRANAGSITGRSEGTRATSRGVAWGHACPRGHPARGAKHERALQRCRWTHAPASRVCVESAAEEAGRVGLWLDEDGGRVPEDAVPRSGPHGLCRLPRGDSLQPSADSLADDCSDTSPPGPRNHGPRGCSSSHRPRGRALHRPSHHPTTRIQRHCGHASSPHIATKPLLPQPARGKLLVHYRRGNSVPECR